VTSGCLFRSNASAIHAALCIRGNARFKWFWRKYVRGRSTAIGDVKTYPASTGFQIAGAVLVWHEAESDHARRSTAPFFPNTMSPALRRYRSSRRAVSLSTRGMSSDSLLSPMFLTATTGVPSFGMPSHGASCQKGQSEAPRLLCL